MKIDIIVQNASTMETRTVIQAIALSDDYNLIRCDISDINKFNGIPVGSVEFVREYMVSHNIKEPFVNPYPINRFRFLKRDVSFRCGINGRDLHERFFIKPVKLKLFTGFVFDSRAEYYDDFTREQLEVLSKHPSCDYWVSDVVEFTSEWRYYIQEENIIGYARYDDCDYETPEPKIGIVQEYINLLDIKHPYVLDFGILLNGDTALVEYNDAWAIGLYGNALSPKQYLNFLIERFNSISQATQKVV